eukprot:11171806-Karenia_brevis.AAC.1
MSDHSCHASPAHLDDSADISQCGPQSQLEPQYHTNMLEQPNLGCGWPASDYAPGTWEVDMMKDEARWSQHDIAIAQATSA